MRRARLGYSAGGGSCGYAVCYVNCSGTTFFSHPYLSIGAIAAANSERFGGITSHPTASAGRREHAGSTSNQHAGGRLRSSAQNPTRSTSGARHVDRFIQATPTDRYAPRGDQRVLGDRVRIVLEFPRRTASARPGAPCIVSDLTPTAPTQSIRV